MGSNRLETSLATIFLFCVLASMTTLAFSAPKSSYASCSTRRGRGSFLLAAFESPSPAAAVSSSSPSNGDHLEMMTLPQQREFFDAAGMNPATMAAAFDAIVTDRYACSRFHRHAEQPSYNATTAKLSSDDNRAVTTGSSSSSSSETTIIKKRGSVSNGDILKQALHVLNLSRRAPSGFNVQPYKCILVHTPDAKERLARHCLGRNADRVLDSDCTVVFLADTHGSRELKRYTAFVRDDDDDDNARRRTMKQQPKRNDKWRMRKLQAWILLFSSGGYPYVPRFLSFLLSTLVRWGVSLVHFFTLGKVQVPTLTTAETWATKNTMLVAMTYMLGCTSRGLTTCPMEGFHAGSIRKALGIPYGKRYSIPVIVSTGLPYVRNGNDKDEATTTDDTGVAHGSSMRASVHASRRYEMEEVIFGNAFRHSIQSST